MKYNIENQGFCWLMNEDQLGQFYLQQATVRKKKTFLSRKGLHQYIRIITNNSLDCYFSAK